MCVAGCRSFTAVMTLLFFFSFLLVCESILKELNLFVCSVLFQCAEVLSLGSFIMDEVAVCSVCACVFVFLASASTYMCELQNETQFVRVPVSFLGTGS